MQSVVGVFSCTQMASGTLNPALLFGGLCVRTSLLDHQTLDHGTLDHGTLDYGTLDHGTLDHQTLDRVAALLRHSGTVTDGFKCSLGWSATEGF